MPAVRARFGFDDDELERVGDWVAPVRGPLGARRRAPRRPYRLDGVAAEHLAGRPRPAAARRRDGRGRPAHGSGWRCRSTTSTATRPTWPAGSPSWSTGSAAAVGLAGRARSRWPRGSRRCSTAVDAAHLGAAARRLAGRRGPAPSSPRRSARGRRPRRHAGAAAASPTSARCSPSGCAAGRPAPTSAPASSPCARWCRCARCRTGWSACSGSTTGCSRAATDADGDDVLARAPAGRRARRRAARTASSSSTRCWPPTEQLVVLYTGADERTGAARARPRCRWASCSTRLAADGPAAPTCVVVRHPLQPFDARNFIAGALGAPGPFSFDRGALRRGAARCRRAGTPRPPFLAAAARPTTAVGDVVELEALVTFLEHPVKAFLRQPRSGLSAVVEEDEPADALPVELDALAAVDGRRPAARAGLAGVDARAGRRRPSGCAATCRPARSARRCSPPLLDEVGGAGAAVRRPARRRPGGRSTCRSTCDDGTRVVGTVPGVHGDLVVRVDLLPARRQAPAARLGPAARAGRRAARPSVGAATVGRGARGGPSLSPARPADRRAGPRPCWPSWSRVYRAGQREPLPLSPKTSCSLRREALDRRLPVARRAGQGATGVAAQPRRPRDRRVRRRRPPRGSGATPTSRC